MSKSIAFFMMLSLTLGLAPFQPEPHILGKLRWLFGGAVGMKFIDYLDLLLHGTPWLMLLISIGRLIGKKLKGTDHTS